MKKAILIATLALAGCNVTPDMSDAGDPTMANAVSDGKRFRVERVEVFRDLLAYDDKRGIYIIRDKETGREYVGVSGIGITEIGSHSCGKSCIDEDER